MDISRPISIGNNGINSIVNKFVRRIMGKNMPQLLEYQVVDDLTLTNKRLTLVMWTTLALTIVVITTTALIVPASFAARSSTNAAMDLAYINSCKADLGFTANSSLVANLTTWSNLQIARTELIETEPGTKRYDELANLVSDLREEVITSTAELSSLFERYSYLLGLSITNPSKFLEECRNL